MLRRKLAQSNVSQDVECQISEQQPSSVNTDVVRSKKKKTGSVPKQKKQRTDTNDGAVASTDSSIAITLHTSEEYLETVDKAQKLEALVLGAESDVIEAISSKPATEPTEPNTSSSIQTPRERKPAWEDEDDNEDITSVNVITDSRYKKLAKVGETKISKLEHRKRLKERFEVVSGSQPAWADLDLKDTSRTKYSDDEDEEERQLSTKTGDYLSTSHRVLAPTYLEFKPVTHANKAQPHRAPVSAVRFHPTSQVIMTASKDQNLSFFQVDGTKNAKIQSLFIENFPIYCARFSSDGCRVILGSKHRSFYDYDMMSGQLMSVQPIKGIESQSMGSFELSPCGKYIAFRGEYGYIHIISTKSKELVCTLKMNGSVNCLTFSHDGQYLYTVGDDAVVYVWQMNSRQCIHRFRDEGCLNGTSIAIDRLHSHIVCGSEAGVVNIYNIPDCLQTMDPKPIKVINNLLTRCTSSRFNSSAQLLALASQDTEKSVKMVNMSSLNVYQNFPSLVEKMANPSDLDFSPNSGYLAAGTSRGIVHMYRLQHFSSY